jgi:acetylcholinesterase
VYSWGESAGAISVALQMLTNGGDTQGLFRAAFMESGAPIPVGDITLGQKYYDALVAETGCSGASDTLQCLRMVDYNDLKAAVDKLPSLSNYQVCSAVTPYSIQRSDSEIFCSLWLFLGCPGQMGYS